MSPRPCLVSGRSRLETIPVRSTGASHVTWLVEVGLWLWLELWLELWLGLGWFTETQYLSVRLVPARGDLERLEEFVSHEKCFFIFNLLPS